MKWLLVPLCLFLAASAWAQPPVNVEEATPAMALLRQGLVDSFNKGDVDGLLGYLDPDVVVTWQNGQVCHGPGQVRAFYQRMMTGDQRIVREIKCDPEIVGRHVEGDRAVSWGNLHDRFVLTDGSDLPFNSVFTANIAKRGDRWLVTAFHTSINAFDNPVLGVAEKKVGFWSVLGGGTAGLLVGATAGWMLGSRRRAR